MNRFQEKRICHRCSKRLMASEMGLWCNGCVRAGLNESTGYNGRERPLGFSKSDKAKALTGPAGA